ncbi:MAG: autotransporter domain-containing protein [Alphaproteobacteria bacterium]|nr:autotransporter domain-containing protein [Alphaproteobacteria bacterium]
MSNNKHFADLLKVCSILPALAIMPAMAEEYTSGDIEKYPYTVKAGDSLLVTEGYSNAENGVFHNNGNLIINDGLTFADNNTQKYGATIYIYNTNATYTNIGNNVVFSGGTALEGTKDYPGMGGAIYTWSDGEASGANVIEMGDNVAFRGNSSVDGGSVMYTYGYNTITIGDNLVVEDNTSSDGYGAIVLNGYDAFHGKDFINTMNVGKNAVFKNNSALLRSGAVYIGGDANDKAVFDDGAQFIGNQSSYGGAIAGFGTFEFGDVSFVSNKSVNANIESDTNHVGNGGAVLNRGDFVVNGNASFLDNYAEGLGGAIYNGGNMTLAKTDFKDNISEKNGGAIYNYGTIDLTGAESTFVGNSAGNDGGAIYNEGTLDIEDAEFVVNSAKRYGGGIANYSKLVLNDVDFEKNNAYVGGAMFLASGSDTIISNSVFDNNTADYGGAVYTATGIKNVSVSDSKFTNNSAKGTGAFGLFNKGTLTNVLFENNKSTDATSSAGALFLGALAQAQLDSVQFVKNTSASAGGAIAMRSTDQGNNKDAKLDIVNSSFVGNVAATNGGAIYSTFYNSENAVDNVYLSNSSFVNNKAANGGAIYNEGLADQGENFASVKLQDLTFANNIASDKGGAIFNGENATIYMSGTNAFINNTANKGANDIYNAGTLNITGGETTIGGGILGNGTLTLAEGAVLNIGNATIRQNNLDIDGIVKVSVLSDRSYGRLIAAEKLDVAESAELHLSLGSVGEYDMFGGKDAGFSTIKYGDTYNVTELGGGIIKVETKSVEQLAQDTGLTTQAAGVVAGLANSHDSTLQHISLVAQQALNAGDKALVEQETKKLNPEEKPVVQAVASAVQNQVLSLASGRMAGGVAMGRAGGDSSQENGFWMHGLFNKSKLDGQFHGYTRGVAFGMDTIIDGKYILGGGLAFNNSDVHSSGRGDIDIDSKTLFLYGQYKPNNWFANMTLTYNMSEYDETKSVFGYNINNIYDVDSYGAQIMGGYDFNTGITTEAGLRYLHIDQDAYADISATKTDFLTSVAGIKYAFAIENDWAIELRPELRAALTYDIISEADAATIDMPGVASYKVAGENLDRLGGEFGIGLTADYKGLKVTLMYDLDLHKDYTSQTGMIKFRTQF